ncbi:MAG: 7-cyano-7-deazaguanine synthase [Planctomycetota bacterium]|nr:7-cyano-7-deazaguanine synthase [Planctomycetota bacterium]
MATPERSMLLIDRGDLPSLVAAVIQPDPARLLLWQLREGDEAAARRAAVVAEHADFLGAVRPVVSEPWSAEVGRASDAEGLWQALMLLQAAIIARHHGCGKIIWPVQVGPDAPRVSELVDRAAGVAELTEAGGGASAERRNAVVIDLPLVDLEDEQIVDLADDAGAPATAFWPCEAGGDEPCGACGGCDRWMRAYRECGLPWPWGPRRGPRNAPPNEPGEGTATAAAGLRPRP